MKTQERFAFITGKCLKKRCRKWDTIHCMASGVDDDEAMVKLHIKFYEMQKNFKEFEITKIRIWDGERDGFCFEFTLFPNEKDNLVEYKVVELLPNGWSLA